MNYDAVLFDAAETLFTTRGSIGQIYGDVAQRFGSTASATEIQRAFTRHFQHSGPLARQDEKQWWKDIVKRVFVDVGMVDDFDGFFDEVYDLFRDSRGWILFPETREVLDAFDHSGLRLGIISNFDSRLYNLLRDLDILPFFDSITICSEIGFAKPDPQIFHMAVRALGVEPGRTLFTGDSLLDDFEAGRNAGLDAFLLDRPNRYAAMQSVPRIANLRELLPIAGIHSKQLT
jgi:putative hydrolase of the HAD superfamily